MTRSTIRIGDTAFICDGPACRVRWMRYRGDFPARSFLQRYPDDLQQFLWRAQEMATYGSIALYSQGHQLTGGYSELHEFKMDATRSWGFIEGREYIVLSADVKKKQKEQNKDYDRALRLRLDFLKGID